MNAKPSVSPQSSPAPLASAQEAEGVAAHFLEVMDSLLSLMQQETELVRGGRLTAAAGLQKSKAALAHLYMADAARLRANRTQLARLVTGKRLDELRKRHDKFRALLQTNLTVMATAHAVSEAIVRGVSDELARKAAPQTYGASGRALAPPRSAAQPLALSRTL